MKINSIQTYLQRCGECDSLVHIPINLSKQTACCPQCNHILQSGNRWSLNRCLIIAISILILLPLALNFPLMKIELLGMPIYASVFGGIWNMATSGYYYTAFLILICSVIMPFTFVLLIILLKIQIILGHRAYFSLLFLTKIKQWTMLDVYFVALAVAAFKVKEYADLSFDIYLFAFVATTLLMTLLMIKIDTPQLWRQFYPEYSSLNSVDYSGYCESCSVCHYTFSTENKGDNYKICPRCKTSTVQNDSLKLQSVWATLIAGIIMMIPANLLPISVTEFAGATSNDSLISGVIAFINMGSYLVATIVFIASILVPFSKIGVILYLLLAIHFQWKHSIHLQMKLLHFVHFVGRWSMLDLFVLALMMSLVNRGQIINFSVGDAAFYFGCAVFLTMIASNHLDPKMLWKIHYNARQAV